MKAGYGAAFVLGLASLALPASAADWWWIGHAGQAPDRTTFYVDRETIVRGKGDRVEVWTLSFGEAVPPSGVQHRATHYLIRCRERTFSTLGMIGYDPEGKVVPMMKAPPTPMAPVAAGSIGESIMNLACGRPSGIEVKVESPGAHASNYLRARPAGSTAASPEEEPGGQDEAEEGGLSLGTGFFVGPNGHILTSHHVVDKARRVGCRTQGGRILEARVERISPANDLALLKVDYRPAQYLGFAPAGSLRAGDRVFTIGYGASNYLGIHEPRFTDGTVSALSGPGAENAWMQISVPVQPGNSGGPLLNESGQVVGIIAAQAAIDTFLEMEGTLPQNINWAVKSDYASPLLSPSAVPARRSRDAAIENARQSVCLVLVDTRSE